MTHKSKRFTKKSFCVKYQFAVGRGVTGSTLDFGSSGGGSNPPAPAIKSGDDSRSFRFFIHRVSSSVRFTFNDIIKAAINQGSSGGVLGGDKRVCGES